jgi:hypothetical protein
MAFIATFNTISVLSGMCRFKFTRSMVSGPLWSKVETGLQWKENKMFPFKVNLIT